MEIVQLNITEYNKLVAMVQELSNKVSTLLSTKKKQIDDDWLDGADVLKALKISQRQLQMWRDDGTIGFTQIGRKKIYYKRVDIERLLETNFTRAYKY